MRISYTFLSTFRKCRQRAYLQYVKKVISYDKVDNRPFLVGTVVDWLFSKWMQEGFKDNWMEEKAAEMFDWFATKRRVVWKDSTNDYGMLRDRAVHAARLLQSCAFAENLSERTIETQKVVEFKKDGFEFYGKMDMWFPEEAAVWDLKITKYKKYLDNFQLYFFSWLLKERGFEVTNLAFFSPLMSPALKEVDCSPTVLQEFEEELFVLLEQIRQKEWEVRGRDCWMCPVFKWCEEPPDEAYKFKKKPCGGFVIEF